MKFQVIPVDYQINDSTIKINGEKPEMFAIVKGEQKRLISFFPNKELADSTCETLNYAYEMGLKES